MKKGFYAILAALAVFALVIACDNGTNNGGGGNNPPPPPPPPPPVTGWVEKVDLQNGNVAAYYFALPEGKTWANYDGIAVDFKVDEETYEAENTVRGGPRLYGNYPLNYFKKVTLTESDAQLSNVFVASIGNGNGEWDNANLILDDGPFSGNWKGIQDLAAEIDVEIQPDEWFTYTYTTDGSKAHTSYNRYPGEGTATEGLYTPAGAGPFIFGLGLTGASRSDIPTATTAWVRNVRLLGTDGTDDLLAKPLYIKPADGDAIPAFVGYSSVEGNGVKFYKREFVDGSSLEAVGGPLDQPDAIEYPTYAITFNLNKPTAATGTAAFDPADFSGTINAVKYSAIGTLPSATLAGYEFQGWALTNSATAGNVTTGKKFYAAANVYAVWTPERPSGTPVDVTFASASDFSTKGGATVVLLDDGDTDDPTNIGYKVTYATSGDNINYGNVNAWFHLDIDALLGPSTPAKTWANVKEITFYFTPISGDVSGKDVNLVASASDHAYVGDAQYDTESIINAKIPTGDVTEEDTLNVAIPMTMKITQGKVTSLTSDTFFSIRIHASNTGSLGGAGSATAFSITNLKIVPFGD
jgi:hypothetical protein